MMRRTFKNLCFIFVATGMFYSTAASAEPIVTIQYKNYKIRGKSLDEIKQAISTAGPKDAQGQGYAAHTDYGIAWDFTYKRHNATCRIDSVTTHLDITFNMPELTNVHEVDEALANHWISYFNALKAHEDGHAQKGMDAALDIEKTLKALPASDDCEALGRTANETGRKIIEKYHNDNVDYDTLTMHGLMQGAELVG